MIGLSTFEIQYLKEAIQYKEDYEYETSELYVDYIAKLNELRVFFGGMIVVINNIASTVEENGVLGIMGVNGSLIGFKPCE